jgi:hypothetical protein
MEDVMTTDNKLQQVDYKELVDLFDVHEDEPTIYMDKKEIEKARDYVWLRAREEERYEN